MWSSTFCTWTAAEESLPDRISTPPSSPHLHRSNVDADLADLTRRANVHDPTRLRFPCGARSTPQSHETGAMRHL